MRLVPAAATIPQTDSRTNSRSFLPEALGMIGRDFRSGKNQDRMHEGRTVFYARFTPRDRGATILLVWAYQPKGATL